MTLTQLATCAATRASTSAVSTTVRTRVVVGCVVVLAGLTIVGCGPGSSSAALDARLDLVLHPSPPLVGPADVTVKLADANGLPVAGADVRLEGNMNHAGMVPTFADLQETEPGVYAGTLQFTMGGDWFILATVTRQGSTLERKIDVPGVRAR